MNRQIDFRSNCNSRLRKRCAKGIVATGVALFALGLAGNAQAGEAFESGFEFELGRITAHHLAAVTHLVLGAPLRPDVVYVETNHRRRPHHRAAHRHHARHRDHAQPHRGHGKHFRAHERGHDRHGKMNRGPDPRRHDDHRKHDRRGDRMRRGHDDDRNDRRDERRDSGRRS